MRLRAGELSPWLLEIATTCAASSLLLSCSGSGGTSPPQVASPVEVPTPDRGRTGSDPLEQASRDAISSADPICPNADWQPLNGLRPAEAYDYVAVLERMGGSKQPVQMRWATGEACATAELQAECKKELERLAQTVTEGRIQTGQIGSQHFLATTQGNQAQAWTSREDWLRFLGAIDTPAEALLLAWYDLYNVQCVTPLPDGYAVTATQMTRDCAPIEITEFNLRISRQGRTVVESSEVIERSDACVGRRPEILMRSNQPGRVQGVDRVAAFFADVAHLEGAAVTAFNQVHRELVLYRAPPELLAQARRAARDEVRHAWLLGRLALQLGAVPRWPAAFAAPARTPLDAAMDNAVEGCVRETFGALVGSYQGLRASCPSVRRIMQSVAQDECRHAELSWHLHQWFTDRLPSSACRALKRAQRSTLWQLREQWREDPEPALTERAGLPSAKTAQRLLDAMEPLL